MWTTHRTPTGNANGHNEYLTALASKGYPITVMVTDNFGVANEGISIARQYKVEDTSTIIYRLTSVGQSNWRDPVTKNPVNWDVPNYDADPIIEGNFYFDATMRRLAIENPDKKIYISFVNEIDKNRSEWLAQFGLQISKRLTEAGLRGVLFNWNSGEPEPDVWRKPHMVKLLKYLETHQNILIGIHEYSFDSYIYNQYPYLVGRFLEIEKACKELGIRFNNIGIAITEFGHGKDHKIFPTQTELLSQTITACNLYNQYSNIRIVAHWVISDNPNWGDAGKMVQKLYTPMTEYTLSKSPHIWEIDNVENPENPEVETYQYLFNRGWYDVANKQVPNGWTVTVAEGHHPESDGQSWNRFADPEARHLTKEYLPSNEWYFLNDAGYCYKVFQGSSPFQVTFTTDYKLLKGRKYSVELTMVNDFYVWDGKKNAELLDDNHAYVLIGIGEDLTTVKIQKKDYLSEATYSVEIEPSSDGLLRWGVGTIWGIPNGSGNNGVFVKSISATNEVTGETKPVRGTPRTTYKKIVVLLPQDITEELYLASARACFDTKTTLMQSADDVGAGSDTVTTGESVGFLRDVYVVVVNPDSWTSSIEDFYKQYYPFVQVHTITENTPTSLEIKIKNKVKEIKGEETSPSFIMEYPTLFYRVNSWYGETRSDGTVHKGTDLRCYLGTPIFAYMDGVVSQVANDANAGGFGIYVKIKHADGHSSIYAHNSKNLVEVGKQVKAGEVIALAGTTGNSTGVHLHFELRDRNNVAYDNTSIVKDMLANPKLSVNYATVTGYIWQANIKDTNNKNKLVTINSTLRADASNTSHAFGTVYQGQCVELTGVSKNGYEEVRCHIMQYTPIPSRDIPYGLHASTTPVTSTGAIDVMKKAKGKVVKILSNITPQSLNEMIASVNPDTYIIRAFLDFGNRVITPSQFFNDTISDVKRAVANVPQGKEIFIELHNEPNLRLEGMGVSWKDGVEFTSWINQVLSLYKSSLPNVKYLYPAMSPGFQSNERQYHISYYEASKNIFNKFNGVAVHSYWNDSVGFYNDIESGIALLKRYNALLNGYDMYVTEASNNMGFDFAKKGTQYASFLREISSNRLQVKAVTFFAVEAMAGTYENELWYANGKSTGIVEAFIQSMG